MTTTSERVIHDGERNSKILMTTVVVNRPYSRLHTKRNQMSVEIINS